MFQFHVSLADSSFTFLESIEGNVYMLTKSKRSKSDKDIVDKKCRWHRISWGYNRGSINYTLWAPLSSVAKLVWFAPLFVTIGLK